jgi:hypothetical protein
MGGQEPLPHLPIPVILMDKTRQIAELQLYRRMGPEPGLCLVEFINYKQGMGQITLMIVRQVINE